MPKKRIVFCTNSSLCSSIILEQLLASDSVDITGIYLSDRIRTKSGSFFGDLYRIINTSGFRYSLYLALGTLFFENIFAPLNKSTSRPTLKYLAKKHNIDVFSSKDINAARSLDWLKKKAPDILFSGFFNQKLEAVALSIPKLGCANLHPALLPKYKGVDPVFYYLLNKEAILGATLHRMDTQYDTGEILGQIEMPAESNRTVFWHNTELFKRGTELFTQWASQATEPQSIEPGKEGEFYDSWPTPAQIKILKNRLFNWRDLIDHAKQD